MNLKISSGELVALIIHQTNHLETVHGDLEFIMDLVDEEGGIGSIADDDQLVIDCSEKYEEVSSAIQKLKNYLEAIEIALKEEVTQ